MSLARALVLKKLTRRYWSSRGRGYDRAPGHSEFSYVWARLLRLALSSRELTYIRAADVGCGTGFISKILIAENAHVICLDIAEGMLREAKRKLQHSTKVDYVQADCEVHMPLRGQSVDLVVSRHVLWTLTAPHIALATWLRAVKKNGILVIFDGAWHSGGSLLKKLLRLTYIVLRAVVRDKVNPLIAIKYNIARISRRVENIDLIVSLLQFLPVRYRVHDLSKLRELMRGRLVPYRTLFGDSRYYMVIISR